MSSVRFLFDNCRTPELLLDVDHVPVKDEFVNFEGEIFLVVRVSNNIVSNQSRPVEGRGGSVKPFSMGEVIIHCGRYRP